MNFNPNSNNLIMNNIPNNNMMNMNMFNMNMFNMMNMDIFNMNNNNNLNKTKIQENNNILFSIISKMQDLHNNIINQMNMNNSLEKLINLLNVNIIITDCISEFRSIIQNNKDLMRELIDNLTNNKVQNIQNNIQNNNFNYICLNNKIKKYLLDNSESNNNKSLCLYKFYDYKNEYEALLSSFINQNISMNNDGIIYNAVFVDENRKKLVLTCRPEEKLNDLFIRYKIIKGCTDKNYSFKNANYVKLNQELKIRQSGLFVGTVLARIEVSD